MEAQDIRVRCRPKSWSNLLDEFVLEPLSKIVPEPQLSAVLPIRVGDYRDGRDLQRAEILLESLSCLAEKDLFRKFMIIAPPNDLAVVQEHLSRWRELPLIFLNEIEVVPELDQFPSLRGWYKQQLLKLAASKLIDSQFYITLDADVICTHPISAELLLPNGKALLQQELKVGHKHWWAGSAKKLGLPARLSEPGMSVTPAILASKICRELIDFLTTRDEGKNWIDYLLEPTHRFGAHQQPSRLLDGIYSWTEYCLYYVYAFENGLLDDYHVRAGSSAVPQLLVSATSLWTSDTAGRWDAALAFSDADPGLFCVIQSARNDDPKDIKSLVAPRLRRAMNS